MARPGRQELAAVCITLIFACLSLGHAAEPARYCVVDLALDPGATVRLSGAVTAPLPATVRGTSTGQLTGSVAIVIPQGESI